MRRDTILPPEPDDEPSEARRPIDDEVRRHLDRASGILRELDLEPPAPDDDEELDEPGCRPLVLELLVTAVAAALLAVCMLVLFVLVCFT